ncbi:MFS transporter [Aquabacterium sp. NJ1]|uniref:MFS transporter n=1 Tax=Aquabacterium sp. NJ1 TaxID=1538295 RepID=UPI000A4303C0|nr:MFS transporter [Aquabacterium sp. NJ1]
MTQLASSDRPIPMGQLLLCGALIVTMSMGIRHSFGLWLQPITMAHGWTREDYSMAMAIQNLVWGASGPVIGWWADRSGAFKVLWAGALLYALGLVGMATASHHGGFILTTGVLIGLAQACSTYTVIFGVVGRNVTALQRSSAMGITAAAGSFGQFLMVPVASFLLHNMDWSSALLMLAATALVIGPLAFGLREARFSAQAGEPTSTSASSATDASPGALQALAEAFQHRDYLLLTAGYFVCGFQLAFIGVHLPSYLKDHQLPPQAATTALALIGLFNVLGSYAAGALGARLRKNWILSSIYFLRAMAMLAFILAPLSTWSVGLFAAAMGTLWLSTVPPTNAIVAQMHGIKHLSMLGGVVFFSHQIGSFLGVWLAGRLYDFTGSYQVVWWLAIALGLLAATINLPIQEQRTPLTRKVVAA